MAPATNSLDVAELLVVVFHFLLQIKQPIAANTFNWVQRYLRRREIIEGIVDSAFLKNDEQLKGKKRLDLIWLVETWLTLQPEQKDRFMEILVNLTNECKHSIEVEMKWYQLFRGGNSVEIFKGLFADFLEK